MMLTSGEIEAAELHKNTVKIQGMPVQDILAYM